MKKILLSFGLILPLVFLSCELSLAPSIDTQNPDSESPVKEANITVEAPEAGDTVSNPIYIKGQARVFEQVVSWRIRDSRGEELIHGFTMSTAPDLGIFGAYEAWLPVPATEDSNITLEVFESSAKDGSDINLVSVPLVLNRTDSQNLQIFYNNSNLDPEISCTTVFPVDRPSIVSTSPARVALLYLLRGPHSSESDEAYESSIPFYTEIKSLNLKSDGTMIVDLKGAIEAPLGGSCLVSSIRAQIESTMKQFSSVKSVEILINGESNRLEP